MMRAAGEDTIRAMPVEFAVQTHGLTRDFGSFRAVDGIDLAVPAGSLYGFLGPNGAGKSTTIKCLTGLLRPTAGTMRILGMDPLADPVAVKRRIGVVPEDLALFDRLTAEETLTFVAQVHGIDTGDRTAPRRRPARPDGPHRGRQHARDRFLARDAEEAVARGRAPARARSCSSSTNRSKASMRWRRAQMKDLLLSFVARGGTIFLTSHILEIVERLSTHIGVIAHGRIVAQGTIDELRQGGGSGESLEELFIGLVGGDARPHAALDWI